MATELYAIGLVILATITGAFGALSLKKGSETLSRNLKSIIYNKNLFIGGFFYLISSIIFVIALKGGELSILYPFVSLGYVWISLLSVKFVGERMNKWKWAGVVFIIIGVGLIGLGS